MAAHQKVQCDIAPVSPCVARTAIVTLAEKHTLTWLIVICTFLSVTPFGKLALLDQHLRDKQWRSPGKVRGSIIFMFNQFYGKTIV